MAEMDGAHGVLNTIEKRRFVGVSKAQGFADSALTFSVGYVAGPPARLDAVFNGVRPSRGADRPRPEHALGGVNAITAAVVAPASVRELPKVLVAGISVDELRALGAYTCLQDA